MRILLRTIRLPAHSPPPNAGTPDNGSFAAAANGSFTVLDGSFADASESFSAAARAERGRSRGSPTVASSARAVSTAVWALGKLSERLGEGASIEQVLRKDLLFAVMKLHSSFGPVDVRSSRQRQYFSFQN